VSRAEERSSACPLAAVSRQRGSSGRPDVIPSRHEDVWDYGGAAGPGPGRAKAFYVEKVGLQALESGFLTAADGQVGLTVGDGVSQLFVYPARVRSSAEFTQAVIHVTDVRAAVEEMRGRGVEFEEYDTPETQTENGIARMPGGGEAAWFKDSEGNLVGVVPA
jgi:predicted enzyme related to lactoylglutathione lyase